MIQVTKVWWDGEKLMAEPIDPAAIYKEPEQPAQQWQSTADKCELEKVPANGSLLPAQQEPVQRYSPDGEGRMEIDSLGAWVKFTSPPAQQEPVAWIVEDQSGERLEWAGDAHSCHGVPTFPLYTSPPTLSLAQRKPLTPDQIEPIAIDVLGYGAFREQDLELFTQCVRAIEAAHGIYAPMELREKNT